MTTGSARRPLGATALAAVVVLGTFLVGGVVGSPTPARAAPPPSAISPNTRPACLLTGSCGPGSPNVNLMNTLSGVSCPDQNSCVAVGNYMNNAGDNQTLVESWNGASWSVVPSPNDGSSVNFLESVSCTSSTRCMAVGQYENSAFIGQALAESWNGTSWSVTPALSPGDGGSLYGVSCTSPTSCMAVGYAESGMTTEPLSESWNGSTWSILPGPDLGPAQEGGLNAVTCTDATTCVAVGDYIDTSARQRTLIASWNGTAWAVVASADPGSFGNSLSDVTCTTSNACVAVGLSEGASITEQTLIESWNGTAWSVVSSPDPGDLSNLLFAVSCATAVNCMAVGTYETQASSFQALVEAWNGTTWSVIPGATRHDLGDTLYAVACAAPSRCQAVGDYISPLVNSLTLVEAWNGGFWSSVPSPNVSMLVAPVVGMASTPTGSGYWLTDGAGDVTTHGAAVNFGSTTGQVLTSPIVGIVATTDGSGYWLVAADGGVFSFGDARFSGSMGGQRLDAPVVGMASTADGGGYWLVAADGGVFSFGDARFAGSMGGVTLNARIVGMAADQSAPGYWLVAADGGVFSFGAPFLGSTASGPLNAPVVGMATPNGAGYWLSGADGGVFAFGDAPFHGSMADLALNQPVVAMAGDPATGGYWLVAADGGVFAFDAPFYGAH